MMYCSLYSLADTQNLAKNNSIEFSTNTRKYNEEHGAKIKQIYYISRDELFPHIY